MAVPTETEIEEIAVRMLVTASKRWATKEGVEVSVVAVVLCSSKISS